MNPELFALTFFFSKPSTIENSKNVFSIHNAKKDLHYSDESAENAFGGDHCLMTRANKGKKPNHFWKPSLDVALELQEISRKHDPVRPWRSFHETKLPQTSETLNVFCTNGC